MAELYTGILKPDDNVGAGRILSFFIRFIFLLIKCSQFEKKWYGKRREWNRSEKKEQREL